MSDRQDALRIADIADKLTFIESAIAGVTNDEFLNDAVLQYAVTFALQIIGEAASRLSDDARAKAPAVPWPKIIGLRHKIAHAYFSIDANEIWRIAEVDAPELKRELTAAGFFTDDP